MMKRCFAFLLMCLCLMPFAHVESYPWMEALSREFPSAECIYQVPIGREDGLFAVIQVDDHALTVILDKDAAGETRLHINDRLFSGGAPRHDELWLNDKFGLMQPFLWYMPENRQDGFYITLQRDDAGAWQISHAEFGADESFCACTAEGEIVTVYGETLYPQVRTVASCCLSFVTFDPVEAEAHCRLILSAPEEYRCYGHDCTENGPCQEHGLYLP